MRIPKYEGYSLEEDRLLRYNNCIYVLANDKLWNLILSKPHRVVYRAHLGVKKMYDLKPLLFWHGMKRDVAKFIAICM